MTKNTHAVQGAGKYWTGEPKKKIGRAFDILMRVVPKQDACQVRSGYLTPEISSRGLSSLADLAPRTDRPKKTDLRSAVKLNPMVGNPMA